MIKVKFLSKVIEETHTESLGHLWEKLICIYGIRILVTFKSIMDVEMTLSKCNFGETMGDECHKLSHTRIQGMEKLSDYCADTVCKKYFL